MNLFFWGMVVFGVVSTSLSILWAYSLGLQRRQWVVLVILCIGGAVIWNTGKVLGALGFIAQDALILNAVLILVITQWIVPFILFPLIALFIPVFSKAGREEVSKEFHDFEMELGIK